MINHERGLLAKNVMIIFELQFLFNIITLRLVEIDLYPKFDLLWYALPFQNKLTYE